jgi:hypothetical protein
MTSFRQIEANRKNALRSSGPRTEKGKQQSRRNALRHGLGAETVIDGLEDSGNYRAFEAAVIADHDAQTAVERELVLRLASLLWRLRRIISIETDLLRIQADIVSERREPFCGPPAEREGVSRAPPFVFAPQQGQGLYAGDDEASHCDPLPMSVRDLTCCFLRLSNVDNGAFERLGRYNAAKSEPLRTVNPNEAGQWSDDYGGQLRPLPIDNRIT